MRIWPLGAMGKTMSGSDIPYDHHWWEARLYMRAEEADRHSRAGLFGRIYPPRPPQTETRVGTGTPPPPPPRQGVGKGTGPKGSATSEIPGPPIEGDRPEERPHGRKEFERTRYADRREVEKVRDEAHEDLDLLQGKVEDMMKPLFSANTDWRTFKGNHH